MTTPNNSTLESALATLREMATGLCDGNGNVPSLKAEEAVALLAYLTPAVPNSWNADEALKRHGLYRELAPPDRGATAIRLLWLEQQNAALLAKIEAAGSYGSLTVAELIDLLERRRQQYGASMTADAAIASLAVYRNPQPPAEGEPQSLTGYAEEQLDAVDASVFSGECYSTTEGKARMVWYLRRWIKELELNP